jgi:hypothetical protein
LHNEYKYGEYILKGITKYVIKISTICSKRNKKKNNAHTFEDGGGNSN